MAEKELPKKWESERRRVKAVQLAFDVSEQVQYRIRREALDMNIPPSDRIRQILGLSVQSRPKRPRLSISLGEDDFRALAEQYGLPASDRVAIKRRAAEELLRHAEREQQQDKD